MYMSAFINENTGIAIIWLRGVNAEMSFFDARETSQKIRK